MEDKGEGAGAVATGSERRTVWEKVERGEAGARKQPPAKGGGGRERNHHENELWTTSAREFFDTAVWCSLN